MRTFLPFSLMVCVVLTSTAGDAFARGGRGGGGGGISRGGGGGFGGGGGGMSRPSPSISRSPSMSRPSPSVNRPSTGAARPGTGAVGSRPGTGAVGNRTGGGLGENRPGAGGRPSAGDLQNFLDLPRASTGAIGGGAGVGNRAGSGLGNAAAGGAAAEFLRSGGAAGDRAGVANRAEGLGNRAEGAGAGNRSDRVQNRTDRRQDFAANRPNRIENRQQYQQNRMDRRDEVRNQVRENHPWMDFWSDHPGWASWRITRPYRWATWAAITGWVGYGWGESVPYSYGDNVYYQDDQVYYGDQPVASAEEYTQQAEEIATSAPQVAPEDAEWMPLGVFALTQDGEKSGAPPTLFLQLAVSKEGIITGTLNDSSTNTTKTIEGAVDKGTQRAAWTVKGKSRPIMETGIVNLTQDTSPALIHFEDGTTQQWLMVRLEEPAEKKQ